MHLDHKIPWNTAAQHFSLVRDNRRYTPAETDLFPRNKESQTRDLQHFCRVFSTTIREFSLTAEKTYIKHAQDAAPLPAGLLFSDELCNLPESLFNLGPHQENSLEHNPLKEQYQHLEYWRQQASSRDPPGYSTAHGDLGDALKALLILASCTSDPKLKEEAFSAIMRLDNDPQVPLRDLNHLSWGHGFGLEFVVHTTLPIYLLLNLVPAIKTRQETDVELFDLSAFLTALEFGLANWDYPAHNILHRLFWTECGVTGYGVYHAQKKIHRLDGSEDVIDPTRDAAAMREKGVDVKNYLKSCFELLYRYDILLRHWYGEEAALERWREAVVSWFARWKAKIDQQM